MIITPFLASRKCAYYEWAQYMIYSVAAWEVQFLISTGPKAKVKIPFNSFFIKKNSLRLKTFL